MKIWLDDCRPAPAGWERATNMAEAQELMATPGVVVEEMSLDHDLGAMPACYTCTSSEDACDMGVDTCNCQCHRELQPTGYDFVKWMAENDKWPRSKPKVHSQNPVGRANMLAVIERYWFDPYTH